MILLLPAPVFTRLQAGLVGTRGLVSSQAVVPAKLAARSEEPEPPVMGSWSGRIRRMRAGSVLARCSAAARGSWPPRPA